MNSRVRSILGHMLEGAQDAITFAGEVKTAEAFATNKLHRKAVIMSILNIGELAKNLPPEFKAVHTQIPWKKIAGMWDVAAHGYHIMDDEIIWDVVNYSIPELVCFIEVYLEKNN